MDNGGRRGFDLEELRPARLSLSRRHFVRGISALGIGLGAAGVLDGRALAADGAPKRGGILKVAISPANTLDPVQLVAPGAIALIQQVAEYLVRVEPDLTLRPVLATSWTASDDGRVWSFELRQGVRFHDGRTLSASDVVASFARLVDRANPTPTSSLLSFLSRDGIVRVDDANVEFRLDRPVANFPYYTQLANAVILPSDYAGRFGEKAVGTGPYRLLTYSTKIGARLERNPDYWGAPEPYVDGIEMLIFETAAQMPLALQSGAVHIVHQLSYLEALALLDDPAINLIETNSADHRQLHMRCDVKPFNDPRVRRAVALCLNRPGLVAGLLGGHGSIANDHPIASLYPERVTLEQRVADRDQAKALLVEAGYASGFDIDLYTHQFLDLPQYAAVIPQMLAAVGIRVRPKVEPTSLYYSHWTEVPFGLTEWTSRPAVDQLLALAFAGSAPWNAAHWKNPDFDALLADFQAEPDLNRRAELATGMARLLNDEVPAVIAYFVKTLRAANGRVRGLTGNLANSLDLSGVWLDV